MAAVQRRVKQHLLLSIAQQLKHFKFEWDELEELVLRLDIPLEELPESSIHHAGLTDRIACLLELANRRGWLTQLLDEAKRRRADLADTLPQLEYEAIEHDAFARELGEQQGEFIGRDDLRQRLARFLETRTSGFFLVTGDPGIGKTAFAAHLAGVERTDCVAYFFRQASSRRTTGAFVEHLLDALADRHGLPASYTRSGLAGRLAERLAQVSSRLAPGEKQLIVVDALDEALREGAPAVETPISVLPEALPLGIYVVLTSRRNHPDLSRLRSRRSVESFGLEADSPMNRETAYTFVARKLDRHLDREAQRRLADRGGWNFLFLENVCRDLLDGALSIAAIESSGMRSVQDYYSARWAGLIADLEPHPAELQLVYDFLGAIAAAPGPVTRGQVCRSLGRELVDFDRAFGHIGQYLRTHREATVAGEEPVASYELYHFSFRQFVLTRVHPELTAFHVRWSDMYAGWRELRGDDRVYALVHLPGHLIEARKWRELAELLTDLGFLSARLRLGGVHYLIGDYRAALAALQSAGRELRDVAEFERFVLARAHVLVHDRKLLLQEAAREPAGSAPACAAIPLLEKDGRTWLRRINEPGVPPTCIRTIFQRSRPTSCAYSPEGRLFSGDEEGMFREYDAHSGECVFEAKEHDAPITLLTFSPDGRRVISASADGAMRFWELKERELVLLRTLPGHRSSVRACAFLEEPDRAATAGLDRSVRIWDLETGSEVNRVRRVVRQARDRVRATARAIAYFAQIGAMFGLLLGAAAVFSALPMRGESLVSQLVFACFLPPMIACAFSIVFAPISIPVILLSFKAILNAYEPCALSRDGRVMAECATRGTLRVGARSGWRTRTIWRARGEGFLRSLRRRLALATESPESEEGKEWCTASALSSDATRFAIGMHTGELSFWDIEAGSFVAPAKPHAGPIRSLAFASDGVRVLSGSEDHSLALWDARTGDRLRVFHGHAAPIATCAVSPDGRRIVSGSADGSLKLWSLDLAGGQPSPDHSGAALACEMSPAGNWLAAAHADGNVRLWSTAEGRPAGVLSGHRARVNACSWASDGTWLVAGAANGTLRLWDAASHQPLVSYGRWTPPRLVLHRVLHALTRIRLVPHVLKEAPASVWITFLFLVAMAGGSALGAVSEARNRNLANAAKFAASAVFFAAFPLLAAIRAAIVRCSISPGGDRVVAGHDDGFLAMWEAASGRLLACLHGHLGSPSTCAFSRDGAFLVTSSTDGVARLWDGRTGKLVRELTTRAENPVPCLFSPEGTRVLAQTSLFSLAIWDVSSGALVAEVSPSDGAILAAAFAPSGDRLVTGHFLGPIHVWSLAEGRSLVQLESGIGSVRTCTFSPDGRWLLTASRSPARSWILSLRETAQFEEKARFWVDEGITEIAWHPDSGSFGFGDASGEIHLLRIVPGCTELALASPSSV